MQGTLTITSVRGKGKKKEKTAEMLKGKKTHILESIFFITKSSVLDILACFHAENYLQIISSLFFPT